ncbi:MAG TPA: DUF2892 domain-containing protein [Gemmatimonadales bacterium]|nr:DUF2892 domain-containing protein [Gemmatimonadales bacterium]
MSTRNVGWRDAGIRAFIGVALLIVSAIFQDRPLVALGIGFLALVFLGTALFGTCPLYTLLRLDTARPPRKAV